MIGKRYTLPLAMVLALLALASAYLFSRFTVDDAFITWRYGRNLVEFGIWGYNPSYFDLTQAYTNPIFAVIGIIPAYFSWDVVFFFKCFSIVTLMAPMLLLLRVVQDKWLMACFYLAFLVLPPTMIHAFGGLETYVFVSVMGLLLISLAQGDIRTSTAYAALLLFVRPEGWMLVGLVPAYYMLSLGLKQKYYHISLLWQKEARGVWKSFLALAALFSAYAAFHFLYFGYVLPNTFYIKTGGQFNLNAFIGYALILGPAAILLLTRQYLLFAFIACFSLPMMMSYSGSDLQADYAQRFAYHLFGPVYLLAAYLVTETGRSVLVRAAGAWAKHLRLYMAAYVGAFIILFALLSLRYTGLNGYQWILQAHSRRLYTGALGQTLSEIKDKYAIRSFAFSDAGMIAYHSRILSFDYNGLGSAMLAHSDTPRQVIEAYQPDIVIFPVDNGNVGKLDAKRQALFDWTQEKRYKTLCDMAMTQTYQYRIFAVKEIPEVQAICAESKRANNSPLYTYRAIWAQPPWHVWRDL